MCACVCAGGMRFYFTYQVLGKSHQMSLMVTFEKGPKGSERENFMEIWEKQFRIEKTVSAKALRYELGESEEQEEATLARESLTAINLSLWSEKFCKRTGSTHP